MALIISEKRADALKIGHTGHLNTNFSLKKKRPLADRKDVKYLCVTWRDLLSNEGTGVSKKEKKLLSREVSKRRFKSLTDTLSDYF